MLQASVMQFFNVATVEDYHLKCFLFGTEPGDPFHLGPFLYKPVTLSFNWMHILGPQPLIMGEGNQYAQLVDNNGSASGNNSCQGEQAPTVGQKNGTPIPWRTEKKEFILEKIDSIVQGMAEKTLEVRFSQNSV